MTNHPNRSRASQTVAGVYTHPNLPTVWIVEDGAGKFWIVFAQPTGWVQRRAYHGSKCLLTRHPLPVLGVGLPNQCPAS